MLGDLIIIIPCLENPLKNQHICSLSTKFYDITGVDFELTLQPQKSRFGEFNNLIYF